MTLTLSADHRVVDGAQGARLLGTIARSLEESDGVDKLLETPALTASSMQKAYVEPARRAQAKPRKHSPTYCGSTLLKLWVLRTRGRKPCGQEVLRTPHQPTNQPRPTTHNPNRPTSHHHHNQRRRSIRSYRCSDPLPEFHRVEHLLEEVDVGLLESVECGYVRDVGVDEVAARAGHEPQERTAP